MIHKSAAKVIKFIYHHSYLPIVILFFYTAVNQLYVTHNYVLYLPEAHCWSKQDESLLVFVKNTIVKCNNFYLCRWFV